MPPRLRTLPERHGGRVVLGLLIAILALGLALRVQAALTPPEDVGNDAAAYMAIAKGALHGRPLRRARQSSPNDWSPGRAAALRAPSTTSRAACTSRRRCCSSRCWAPARSCSPTCSRRRLAGPVAGRDRARCWPPPTRRSSTTTGRLLAEPVALFWLPAAMLAFLWASDGGRPWRWLAPGALLGLTTLTRPEYLPFVAAVRAARARRACGSATGRGLLGRRRRRGAARRRLLRRAGALDGAQRDRARPLRPGHHGRRQGAVRRHLPARRRPPAARQAPADRALLRQEGPPVRGGPADRDGSRCSTGSPRSTPTSAATPRWPGSAARTSPSTPPSSRSTTPGW